MKRVLIFLATNLAIMVVVMKMIFLKKFLQRPAKDLICSSVMLFTEPS